MNDCIFCKIINKEIPCYKLYEDDLVLVFLDINPICNGHTLIIPKKHFKDAFDIEDEYILHIFKKAQEIAKLLEEKLNIKGLKLVQNNGNLQEVKHYHLHLIPSYKNEKKLSVEDIYNTLTK